MRKILSNTKVSAWIIALLISLNVITIAFIFFHLLPHPTDESKDSRGKYQRGFADFMIRELKLSDEQTARFDTMHSKHIEEKKWIMDDLHHIKSQLFELSFAAEPDTLLADSLLRVLANTTAVFERMNMKHLSDIRSICTPEQEQKLKKMAQRMFARNQDPSRNFKNRDSDCK